jgi:hypothetical protein
MSVFLLDLCITLVINGNYSKFLIKYRGCIMKKYYSFLNLKFSVIKISLFALFISILISPDMLAQYKRNIIFEEFSEVWCGPCASLAPMLSVWLDNHPDYIPIIYYSYFTDNGKKVTSPSEYNERKKFYSVPFYPYARINAVNAPNEQYPGFPTDTSRINSIIDTMSKTTPVKVVIDFTNAGAVGNIKVAVTSDLALENKFIYVILVEKHHTYEKQSNGQSEFHHIMRKILTPPGGEKLTIKAGETLNFEYHYSLDAGINKDLYATAIVQDTSTKYIYQAESVFKSPSTSVYEDNEQQNILSVFPNPVSDKIGIKLNSDKEIISKIELFDLLGNKINSVNVSNQINNFSLPGSDIYGNDLPDGIYFLKVRTEKSLFVRKFVVSK